MPESAAALLARYGYAALFVGVFLESAGVPLPGETALLAAAFLAHQGVLSLPVVVAVAFAAAVLGDNAGYWIGRRGGRPLVERYGRLVGLTPARLATLDALARRYGAGMVVLARFVSGLRVAAAILAGASGLPWRRFLLFNAVGALAWALLVGIVGDLFGRSWGLIETWLGRSALLVVALVGLVALAWLVRRRGRRRAAAAPPPALAPPGLLLAAAGLTLAALFAGIVGEVVAREAAWLDRLVGPAVDRLRAPWLDAVMPVVAVLGDPLALLAVVAVLVAWCVHRREARAALALAAVAAAGGALNALLEAGFGRPRPALPDGLEVFRGSGVPSGHAMGAVAVYGMAALVVARLDPRLRRPAAAAASLLALAVGVSRVYLDAGRPADVLAGFAAGACLLVAGACLVDRAPAAPGGEARGNGSCARGTEGR